MRADWLAAALLGLITSTWSTLVSQLAATRLGRDPWTDWMVVASIPMQGAALQAEPSWWVVTVGILFHQSADFFWALVFFGLFRRWTASLSPWAIAAVAPFWAVFTSASEYFVIVPFWQPIFVLEQPYWIGLLVHVTSAALYPLFPWLRDKVAGRRSAHARFAGRWAAGAGAVAAVLLVLGVLGGSGREWPPYLGARAAEDAAWMRRMGAHHAQGIAVARIAETQAQDPRLRGLARLMIAAQAGDIAVLDSWHRGWFGMPLPPASEADHAAMPGALGPAEIAGLDATEGAAFDRAFILRMTRHHLGAVAMADEALRSAGDPRLRLMGHALRHAQRGEVALMHGIPRGFAVSAGAWDQMLSAYGDAAADHLPQ